MHSHARTPTASRPLFRDALGNSSSADAGLGALCRALRGFCELQGALSPGLRRHCARPLSRVGVCPSGCMRLRMGDLPERGLVFLCVSHLCSIVSQSISLRRGLRACCWRGCL